jgi:hypothetical protein
MDLTNVDYSVELTQAPMLVGDDEALIMTEVRARRGDKTLQNFAAHLLRVADGKIVEMYMVDAKPAESDAFWAESRCRRQLVPRTPCQDAMRSAVRMYRQSSRTARTSRSVLAPDTKPRRSSFCTAITPAVEEALALCEFRLIGTVPSR